MIEETRKVTKYNRVITIKQRIIGYLATFVLSVLFATFLTFLLAFHARNEMIKNLYQNPTKNMLLNANVAKVLIGERDYLEDILNKNYETCVYVGDLYFSAGEYRSAQLAYESAVSKAKIGKYKAHYKLLCTLLELQEFDKAVDLIENTKDKDEKNLVKFKTRSYITVGDKYYSVSKFLSAAKAYEKAEFYYTRFIKRDDKVEKSIISRITNSYIKVGDLMVSSGMNSEALRFLRKAEEYAPDDFNVKYRIGIILSDFDPEEAIKFFEPMLDEKPQYIDYGVYSSALMKAANIADLDNRPTQAKYYRYKIHSIDLFVNRKVVYKNDIETILEPPVLKKRFFVYPIKLKYHFLNASQVIIPNLYADFILTKEDKKIETITIKIADKRQPLIPGNTDVDTIYVNFNKKIFTKKDLENYSVKIYAYKDKKYKTLICETKVKA